MGHAVKNELHLEKLATFGKTGLTVKNRAHCKEKKSQGMMLSMSIN